MKNNKPTSSIRGREKSGSTPIRPWLETKLTAGGWEELRRWQRHVFEKLYALSGYPSAKQKRELRRLTKLAKDRKEAEVGVFFIINGKLVARSSPWSVVPPFGGYRTYGLGLCDFCNSLVDGKKVPALTHYDSIPRGRTSFDDTAGQFTVYTDLCTAKSEQWIRAIMKKFHLPPSTRVIVDAQYACSQCSDQLREAGYHHTQLDSDWNYLNAVIKWG